MPTLTGKVIDITGFGDNDPIFFSSLLRVSSDNESLITTKQVRVEPVQGLISLNIEQGPALVVFGNQRFAFSMPDHDAELRPLILAGIALPPDLPSEILAEAIESYMQEHPVSAEVLAQAIEEYFGENPAQTDWNHVSGKPAFFSGAYADLLGKPSLFSGSYLDLSDKPTFGSAAFASTGAFATATQGAKADSALQNASAFATAAQGTKADSAVQPAGISTKVNGFLNGTATGINVSVLTETAYQALGSKDPNTVYIRTAG